MWEGVPKTLAKWCKDLCRKVRGIGSVQVGQYIVNQILIWHRRASYLVTGKSLDALEQSCQRFQERCAGFCWKAWPVWLAGIRESVTLNQTLWGISKIIKVGLWLCGAVYVEKLNMKLALAMQSQTNKNQLAVRPEDMQHTVFDVLIGATGAELQCTTDARWGKLGVRHLMAPRDFS